MDPAWGTGDEVEGPIEVAAHFFNGVSDPRVGTMDFSLDGQYFLSTHADDALRLIDVPAIRHTATIHLESFGVHCAKFTQSPDVVCVAPRDSRDGHLYLMSLTAARLFSALSLPRDALPAVGGTPVHAAVSQCPATDVLAALHAAEGRLLLFHPNVSAAIAASPARALLGHRGAVTFAADGRALLVGDDQRIRLFDRRRFLAPAAEWDARSVFSRSGGAARCRGAEMGADGPNALLTSAAGETVVLDTTRGEVTASYFHGNAQRHFLGAGEAVGAKYVFPRQRASMVAQPTTHMCAGRHLLVYAGQTGEGERANEPTAGALRYELQCKDSDVPVALSVNPKYALVATAARFVTWWAFNIDT